MQPKADLVSRAQALARRAHAGQRDKSGKPYVDHPARVAARVVNNPEAAAVAWLHDVLEDTEISSEDIAASFPANIVAAVVALTKTSAEPLADYYARVRANPLALQVKLADIADNIDPARTALLEDATRVRLEAKYAAALRALGKGEAPFFISS